MKIEFWLERWQQGEIGFHQQQYNPYLQRHWSKLGLARDSRVFVPLCGKSLDLLWLQQQGHRVTGVEVSREAVEDFWQENDIPYIASQTEGFQVFRGEGMEILVGDYFQLASNDLPGVNAVYDRAALVAMSPEMRDAYARKMADLLSSGSKMLLVTMEYQQSEMSGPPFSVTEGELKRLYGHDFDISLLDSESVLNQYPRFQERGLSALEEKIWVLQRF